MMSEQFKKIEERAILDGFLTVLRASNGIALRVVNESERPDFECQSMDSPATIGIEITKWLGDTGSRHNRLKLDAEGDRICADASALMSNHAIAAHVNLQIKLLTSQRLPKSNEFCTFIRELVDYAVMKFDAGELELSRGGIPGRARSPSIRPPAGSTLEKYCEWIKPTHGTGRVRIRRRNVTGLGCSPTSLCEPIRRKSGRYHNFQYHGDQLWLVVASVSTLKESKKTSHGSVGGPLDDSWRTHEGVLGVLGESPFNVIYYFDDCGEPSIVRLKPGD